MMVSDWFEALLPILILALFTWLISVFKKDVSIVDSIWPLMIFTGGVVYTLQAQDSSLRMLVILGLVAVWSLRLSIFLTWRNWGEPEDARYRAIREKNSPHFALKSLGIIFLLQAILAWFISLPLWPVLSVSSSFGALDVAALLLWCMGMFYETVSDWQLARFKADTRNQGLVMNEGLWRHTRHPNYFGEALIWWAYYLFALAVGAWWTLPAPLLMTWLLLRFSGVALLEKSIVSRRAGYRDYIATTNAFIPGPLKGGLPEKATEGNR